MNILVVNERPPGSAQRLTVALVSGGNLLNQRTEHSGTPIATSAGMRRWMRRLGVDRWAWQTCWKSLDFWLIVGSIVLPGGFLLLLLPRHPLRVTLRRSRG